MKNTVNTYIKNPNEWCLGDTLERLHGKTAIIILLCTWAFQTLSHSEFKFYGDLFYSNKSKIIQWDLLELSDYSA